jgi:hypothetical protein
LARFINVVHWFRSARSASIVHAFPPSDWIFSATLVAASPDLLKWTMTFAPACAKPMHSAFPMRFAPPVINAVRPEIEYI